eukprot:TRINITY_DN266_c0_g1_i1.p1 TRINITY_DN266_c0_g1~~TRINITY_DN266_c0_g1_i1.p1  ORF type:complete len:488 (+),score=132.70 TRINITY_DN266_c0_g1_i1:136-1464(+)
MAAEWENVNDLRERMSSVSIGAQGAGSSSIPIGGRQPEGPDRASSFSLHGRGAPVLFDQTPRSGDLQVDYDSIHLQYDTPAPHWRRRRQRRLAAGAAEAVARRLSQEVCGVFAACKCYDVMPPSTLVVVTDVSLPLKVAFMSALENRVPFAVLWDPQKQQYVGVMTVTDYIRVLLHRRQIADTSGSLEETPIRVWRRAEWMRREGAPQQERSLISVGIDASVLSALRLLHNNSIKRVPLLGPAGELLHVLNYSAMLALLLEHVRGHLPSAEDGGDALMTDGDTADDPPVDDAASAASSSLARMFEYSVGDLGIGVYDDAGPVVHLETPVHEVLTLLMRHRRHSLPIVDSRRRILDVFSRNDVLRLEQQGFYNIEIPLGRAIGDRERFPVATFTRSDSLGAVAELLGSAGVRTLYCVDEEQRACGHLGVTHIFDWLLRHAPAS